MPPRQPPKVDKIVDPKTGFVVDIRLDKVNGLFHAVFQGEHIEDPSLTEIRARLERMMREGVNLTWTPYIFAETESRFGGGEDFLSLDVQRGWFARSNPSRYLHANWLEKDDDIFFDTAEEEAEFGKAARRGKDSDAMRLARSHNWAVDLEPGEYRKPHEPKPDVQFGQVITIHSSVGVIFAYVEELYRGLRFLQEGIEATAKGLTDRLRQPAFVSWVCSLTAPHVFLPDYSKKKARKP